MNLHFPFLTNRCKNVQFKKEKGLAGEKGESDMIYKKVLEERFASIHGQVTPKWAQLVKKDDKKTTRDSDEEDDDRELTKVYKNYN